MKSFFRYTLALLGLVPVTLFAVEDGKYADFAGVKIHYPSTLILSMEDSCRASRRCP